ncbi:MAG: NADH-quinone oxidoreductase subunit L [Chthoniobacteraceae bacterium]
MPWIILFAPLISAVVIVLFTQKWKNLSALISIAAVLVSLAASITLFLNAPDSAATATIPWLDFTGFGVPFKAPISFTIDGLSKAMMIVVTFIGALIHIYSWAYMADDEGKSRYFAGLSLFMFSMLGIVFANNFLMMFIFWELVGVSSFILIGHWYFRNAPAAAANKAFICNRLGDFGFLFGILLVWVATKSLDFEGIKQAIDSGNAPFLAVPAFATATVVLLFCGTIGKSAQFPLHVWLPDAMEGPTPVSALIHAATMVAAGVYMLARIYFIVSISPYAMQIIAVIGTTTAFGAALIATQQNDIKKVLAYSTLSQLGYMVMAVGVAASSAAMFHLFTHAFFKALLFLGAGSVIFACHHEQDIWKMGGLVRKQPITFICFLAGTLALMGIPLFSGFYSKDSILVAAYEHHRILAYIGLFTALLTAYYMTRLFVIVFFGKAHTEAASHAHEAPVAMWGPLVLLAIPSVIAGYASVAGHFLPVPEHHGESIVPSLAIGAGVIGILIGALLYFGKAKDPIRIPLFANKFYLDEIYAQIIWYTQDLLARICAFIDRWILDTAIVRGLSSGTWAAGFVMRFAQAGNLQGYALLFGAGVVALFYFILFIK